jgi:hypothetical protein
LNFFTLDFFFSSTIMQSVCRLARTALPRTVMARRGYHEKVIEHYERPRNVGSMDKKNPLVGTGLVGAPACGDVMKLQILVDPLSRRITDVKFKTFGCGSAIASSSFATERIKGLTLVRLFIFLFYVFMLFLWLCLCARVGGSRNNQEYRDCAGTQFAARQAPLFQYVSI